MRSFSATIVRTFGWAGSVLLLMAAPTLGIAQTATFNFTNGSQTFQVPAGAAE